MGPNGKGGGAIRSLGGPGSQAFHKQEAERQGIEGGVRVREAGLRVGAGLSVGSVHLVSPAPNSTYLPSLQWLLLFNFPRPCRVRVDAALPAGGPKRRLRSPLWTSCTLRRLRLSPATHQQSSRPPPTCRWSMWSRHAASSRPGEGSPNLVFLVGEMASQVSRAEAKIRKQHTNVHRTFSCQL